MQTGHEAQLEQLPGELLAMIFGFVPTKDLYPSCFVLSSACLAAVLDELAWRARSEQDLGVTRLLEGQSSWFNTYRDSRFVWDQEQELRIRSFSWVGKCSISFPSPDLVFWTPDAGSRMDYITVRSKQSFSTGLIAVEFIIEQCNTFTWSVGFIDDNFDASTRVFNQPRNIICYSWCNKPSASHSVTGSPTEFSRQRKVLEGWKEGDVLGALLDFERREIQYFRNNKWNEMVKLHPESKRLWAMTNMFSSGNAVRIRIKSVGSIPPEWQLR
ncbi:hypothetical protein QOT17_007100 [Balamuthia mandrillaris]